MLNRLMFIYFFQRKGFLDNDQQYLRNRLRLVQQLRGSGQFLSFYRYFLRRLFHEGLGTPEAERDPGLEALLGRVPYLTGGLFDAHQLELSIWRKLKARPTTAQYLAAHPDPEKAMHYRTVGGGYWWSFLNYEYPARTASSKVASFNPPATVDLMAGVYNSTLFYWYYSVTFDAFNLKEYVIWDFHFDPGCVGEDGRVLEGLAGALMENYRTNAEFIQRGPSMSYTVYPKLAKPIIDQIDGVLARHYGFSAEELDFILNYDVKCRLGASVDAE